MHTSRVSSTFNVYESSNLLGNNDMRGNAKSDVYGYTGDLQDTRDLQDDQIINNYSGKTDETLIRSSIKQVPSRCQICYWICSCHNFRGFWYTKLGKLIKYFPIIILSLVFTISVLMGLGILTTKIVLNEYNINNGCHKGTMSCKMPIMCYYDDTESLILGCSAIGSISFAVIVLGILITLIITGSCFYCFDSCTSEIRNTIRHSRFIISRHINDNDQDNPSNPDTVYGSVNNYIEYENA